MRLHKQTKEPYCLIYASAMMLDMEPTEIFSALGERKGLYNYHIQEIIDLALARGVAMVQVDYAPWAVGSFKHLDDFMFLMPEEQSRARFITRLEGRRAIVCNSSHVVAWDGKEIYDPRGRIYSLDTFIKAATDRRHVLAFIGIKIKDSIP